MKIHILNEKARSLNEDFDAKSAFKGSKIEFDSYADGTLFGKYTYRDGTVFLVSVYDLDGKKSVTVTNSPKGDSVYLVQNMAINRTLESTSDYQQFFKNVSRLLDDFSQKVEAASSSIDSVLDLKKFESAMKMFKKDFMSGLKKA